MNGSNGISPELPIPMSSPEQGVSSPEAPGGIEVKTGGSDSASQGPTTAMPTVDPSQFASLSQPSAKTAADDQASEVAGADDADVIEKEWVTKAKAIVSSTRSNPNQQSSELSKFKAEYIKKRFNKEVKTVKEIQASL